MQANENINIDDNQTDEDLHQSNRFNPPLNQILYGPPGTGKTYNTINKALEILGVEIEGKSRAELKTTFDEFRKNGQIEFITFHQSFAYEEFVEGIKPNIENQNAEMTYKIKDGIFKKVCIKAKTEKEPNKKMMNSMTIFEEFYNHLLEKENWTLKGISFTKCINVIKFKRNEPYKYYELFKNELYEMIQDATKEKTEQELKDIFRQHLRHATQENLELCSPAYIAIIQYYFEYYIEYYIPKKPYILIIDEINRGNISKILGELITLIEPSKRIGADEELRVSLPYSANEFDGGKGFGVPKNLYIIGTMNTADRSIALLDTALRRRFEFVEMMPEPELLEIIKVENGEINLQLLLEKMNARIEFLLDREHTIGHSFFINVDSLSKLQQVFKNKIIPLLQEYFYDDYKKIQAVLNDNQMIQSKPQPDFLNKFHDEIDSEKDVYAITNFEQWDERSFMQIYENHQ